MTVHSDRWILDQAMNPKHPMIEPFATMQVRQIEDQRIISYGLSSYGYDLSIDPMGFQVFYPIHATEIDPKRFDHETLLDVPLQGVVGNEQWWLLPPHTYALAVTREYLRIPRSVLGLCLGKSTYARSGLVFNMTPLEPEWEGNLVIEISNSADLPIRVYANEGIAQVVFLEGEDCLISYADRGGKYQAQRGVQTPLL